MLQEAGHIWKQHILKQRETVIAVWIQKALPSDQFWNVKSTLDTYCDKYVYDTNPWTSVWNKQSKWKSRI